MFDNVKFDLSPTRKELNEIHDWLRKSQTEDSNFYGNWAVIERAFHSNKLISFDLEKEPIGYLVWNSFSNYVSLDIFQLRKEYCETGWGKCFFNLYYEFVKNINCPEIRIESLLGSEGFWLKMGFKEIDRSSNFSSDYTHFRRI